MGFFLVQGKEGLMAVAEKTEVCDADEKVIEMELERLRTFENHPFKVQADSQMIELQDSIKSFGILNPLIVRPRPDGVYEIISGHRRRYAAEQLGYRKVPGIMQRGGEKIWLILLMLLISAWVKLKTSGSIGHSKSKDLISCHRYILEKKRVQWSEPA